MEWTRELRYRTYEDWDAKTLLKLISAAQTSPYQQQYHFHPTSGLINDPNGFSYYNGQWHLFYQSFPFGAAHGLKSWGHLVSDDLVHWKNLGLAIYPDTKYDSHGAYSGSALPIGDKLFLMYSGNHRTEDWTRTSYQVGAYMDEDNQIKKLAKPLITPPDHVTEHFRDPQIIKYRESYYVILGAQDKQTMAGQVMVYKSKDLKEFKEVGYLNFSDDPMGYMIECPNLVFIDDKPVLIFCPQGLDKEVASYDNIYPNMYVVGDGLKLDAPKMETNQPAPLNFDEGFDVYATQAFTAPDGKTYAVSWVGLPDVEYPTDKENWAGTYTQVKELHLSEDGHLIQRPVPAMASLRGEGVSLASTGRLKQTILPAAKQAAEFHFQIEKNQRGTLHLAASQDLSAGIELKFNTEKGAQLVIDRTHAGIPFATEYKTTRTLELEDNQALDLQIFMDNSLCEIFVNGGKQVATLRFFAKDPATQTAVAMTGETGLDWRGTYWPLTY